MNIEYQKRRQVKIARNKKRRKERKLTLQKQKDLRAWMNGRRRKRQLLPDKSG